MSGGTGANVQLVSRGVQDSVIIDSVKGDFPFKTVYTRSRNFAMSPKKLTYIGQIQANGTCIVPIQTLGDLLTGVWLEGPSGLAEKLDGTTFELFVGGQLVQSITTEYIKEIWNPYLADTQAKVNSWDTAHGRMVNNTWYPLHFWFCDNDMFLPIVALSSHPVEIRISWGTSISSSDVTAIYGNYVFLDTKDRDELTKRPIDILITQVQKMPVANMKNVDLSVFNHSVKAIFFGPGGSFDSVDIMINGTYLLEQMSSTFFTSAQQYYNTKLGNSPVNLYGSGTQVTPTYTGFFVYSFSKDLTDFRHLGSCNFSMIDSAKMNINGCTWTSGIVYALNYNVFHIEKGQGGVVWGN